MNDSIFWVPYKPRRERQNLNIRMGNRRMTRLTNAFSKKAEKPYAYDVELFHALQFRAHSWTLNASNGG